MSQARYWWATGLGLVALFLALAFWDPAAAGGPDLCLFHRVTGVACPACGLTRAAAAFAHGDLRASWRWHPLFLFLAAEVGTIWLAWGWALRRRSHQFPVLRQLAPRVAIGTGSLLLLVWLARLAAGTLPA
jgi:hypothetical protein